MTHYRIDPKDVFFILKEQLDYGRLCRLERYRDLNEKSLDLLVTEAIRLAKGRLSPLNAVGERVGVSFERGRVTCPPEFKHEFRRFGRDGWIAVARDPAFGGQGFPHMMRTVVNEFMYGACQAFNMAASLTHGAAHLIETFGSTSLKQRFVAPMYAGRWAGTMCLTEPAAGSNLGAIETTAVPEGGHYRIHGSKVFISWGDHDLTENIVHLVLARVTGAPAGSRGLSLFVIPKRRVSDDGTVGAPNDVTCSRVEEKLGLHASPTAALEFGARDGCIGYRCGEENRGLSHMFQMMNAARINTGVSGLALAGTAYRHAVEYARDRVQGADLAGRDTGEVPILRHPDVRRMLLEMKARVDGMRSLIYSGAFWLDLALELPASPEREHYADLTDFLTPVIKAYCSTTGFRVCETAIQCLGGYGYCKDYPLEQYLRDAKIMSLYEGTNGIQSIDLVGRKLTIRDGACLNAFRSEIDRFCEAFSRHPELGAAVRQLSRTAGPLWELAKDLRERRRSDPPGWGACTYPALTAFSDVAVAWRLLDMARVAMSRLQRPGTSANFYQGKRLSAVYFADTVLHRTRTTIELCRRGPRQMLDMPDAAF